MMRVLVRVVFFVTVTLRPGACPQLTVGKSDSKEVERPNPLLQRFDKYQQSVL
jgi:hypothetical protein